MIRDFLNAQEDCEAAEAAAPVRTARDPSGFDPSPCDLLPLAMMYAPMQQYRALLDPSQALCEGTLFAELNYPFLGGGAK